MSIQYVHLHLYIFILIYYLNKSVYYSFSTKIIVIICALVYFL